MTTDTRRIVDGSTAAALVTALASRVRAWVASSRLVNAGESLADAHGRATDSSSVVAGGEAAVRWTRHSFCYWWLTEEPDPDVIVIDLRDTYAVGPFIALLDRVVPRYARAWRTSNLGATLDDAAASVRDAPIRAAGIVAAVAVLANALLVALDGSLTAEAALTRVAGFALALAGTRVRTPWDELAGARTVRLLAAALESPEPPAEDRRE